MLKLFENLMYTIFPPMVSDDLFATKPKGAISSKVSIGVMTGITCEALTFIRRKNHFYLQ